MPSGKRSEAGTDKRVFMTNLLYASNCSEKTDDYLMKGTAFYPPTAAAAISRSPFRSSLPVPRMGRLSTPT